MGILQAWILEWIAMPSSRASSQPRDRTQVSCIVGGFFTIWAHIDYRDQHNYKAKTSDLQKFSPCSSCISCNKTVGILKVPDWASLHSRPNSHRYVHIKTWEVGRIRFGVSSWRSNCSCAQCTVKSHKLKVRVWSREKFLQGCAREIGGSSPRKLRTPLSLLAKYF